MLDKLKTYFLLFGAFGLSLVHAQIKQATQSIALAPGYSNLKFAAPIPGTYKLPLLGQASDGDVLDSSGHATTLHNLMGNTGSSDKIVLLSFIYATCSDINGCPLATAVFHKIKNRLEKDPELASHIHLITLSFNPDHDTPERMKDYGKNFQSDAVDWHFLTTRSEQELKPILKAYKQTVEKIYDSKGKFTNTFNHNLRVYLIDQHKQLRNIYNTELLHPDTLVSDILTLLQPETKPTASASVEHHNPALYRAGDNKQDYGTKTYQTNSIALVSRTGKQTNLFLSIKKPPLGLPPVPMPENNLITPEKISLGRKLFYDRRMSINNTFSCAMCHIPEQGFTNNEMATAVGVEGRTVRRNSPTLYNVAYMKTLFHDGRESTLENQVWSPLLAHNEMANPSIGYVIDKINNASDYDGLFKAAFDRPANMETISMAIASYERTLNSANSPFDRWYYEKDDKAIEAKTKRGFELFMGKAGCSQCHTVDKDYALFTDNKLHNTGIGFDAAMAKPTATTQRVQLAPGVFTEIPNEVIASVSETKANDLGRYEVTQNPKDRWLYKTPSLRNVSLTAPYMHNGSIASLREVVEFYNRGGIANENLDRLIKPLNLPSSELDELESFLANLTGNNVETLVSDAFAALIGESK